MTEPSGPLTQAAAVSLSALVSTLKLTDLDALEPSSKLALAVVERCAAEDYLRASGINPSPADIEAWLGMSGRQRREVSHLYDVWHMTDVVRGSVADTSGETPENPS